MGFFQLLQHHFRQESYWFFSRTGFTNNYIDLAVTASGNAVTVQGVGSYDVAVGGIGGAKPPCTSRPPSGRPARSRPASGLPNHDEP
jgi:hypothetical protein